jgi:hypothetical protein
VPATTLSPETFPAFEGGFFALVPLTTFIGNVFEKGFPDNFFFEDGQSL